MHTDRDGNGNGNRNRNVIRRLTEPERLRPFLYRCRRTDLFCKFACAARSSRGSFVVVCSGARSAGASISGAPAEPRSRGTRLTVSAPCVCSGGRRADPKWLSRRDSCRGPGLAASARRASRRRSLERAPARADCARLEAWSSALELERMQRTESNRRRDLVNLVRVFGGAVIYHAPVHERRHTIFAPELRDVSLQHLLDAAANCHAQVLCLAQT